jgi:hypothetical protein
MPNHKTWVIEQLFNARWNATTQTLSSPDISLNEVKAEIEAYNLTGPPKSISTKNPANFFKDFVRNLDSANKSWPAHVFANGYTGVQQTSNGRCFSFIPAPASAPTPFVPILPTPTITPLPVSTLQIPLLARKMSRRDERWLMQVAVRLQLLELHLSTSSKENLDYVELVQMGIKQNIAEIDALYMGHDTQNRDVLITVEAKTSDDIYVGQIVSQVLAIRAMKSLKGIAIDRVIPLAIKAVKKAGIFVVEFESVKMTDPDPKDLSVVSESMISLNPTLKNLI